MNAVSSPSLPPDDIHDFVHLALRFDEYDRFVVGLGRDFLQQHEQTVLLLILLAAFNHLQNVLVRRQVQ